VLWHVQQNATQLDGIQQDDTKHYGMICIMLPIAMQFRIIALSIMACYENVTRSKGIQKNATQHNDIHDDNQHNYMFRRMILNIMEVNRMPLRIRRMTLN
jgi:hypothetical protein